MPTIADYVHTPGNPVLDRVSAELAITNHGRIGHAIAVGDLVRVTATEHYLTVQEVDHYTGQLTAAPSGGGYTATVAGVDVEVVALAPHPTVPDDFLKSMTLEQALAAMAPIASDYGRYPQYGPGFFDGWVFGRVKQDIRFRDYPTGPVDFPARQRVLVRTDDRTRFGSSSPDTVTAWSTRRSRHGCAISVWRYRIRLEA